MLIYRMWNKDNDSSVSHEIDAPCRNSIAVSRSEIKLIIKSLMAYTGLTELYYEPKFIMLLFLIKNIEEKSSCCILTSVSI